MQLTAHTTFYGLTIEQANKIVATDKKFNASMVKMVNEIYGAVIGLDSVTAFRAQNWYFEANAFAAELAASHNVSIEIASAVISAVSPRMPWLRNKTVANSILAQFRNYSELSAVDAAKEIGLALGANVSMAIKIARGADISQTLTGVKRRSFYNNIVAPATSDSVTVDTWMMQAFCNTTGMDKASALRYLSACDVGLYGSGAGYIVISEAVREVARDLSLTPSQVQAIYWVSQAKNFDGGRPDTKG